VSRKIKLGILASGRGSNIPSLVKAIESGELNAEIALVICNRSNAEAIQVAQSLNIPSQMISPDLFNSKEEYDGKVALEFWNRQVELIVLCGYTRVLSLPIIKTYDKRIVNTHPSLLPAFGGKGMYGDKVHQAALKRGVKISGCSIHLIDENIDEGPLLKQAVLDVLPDDTVESLKARIIKLEEKVYPQVIQEYGQQLAPIDFAQVPYTLKEMGGMQSAAPSQAFFDDQKKEFHFKKNGKEVYGLCDVGLKRKENADTIIVTSDLRLMGVADGVGSAKEGKQTSRMIMSFIEKKWFNEGTIMRLKSMDHASWLRKTVIEANQQILAWARQGANKADIGSTLSMGIIDEENNDIYISNTGDSRCYLWRSEVFYRLTRDHSVDFDPESGEGGALIFYMGGGQGAFGIDLFHLHLYPGDRILFCSDGLLYATEDLVAQRFKQNLPIKDLCNQLLKDAYDVGAPDNTSIVVLDC
jgi:phosphoribosylglycinamide formyltransferase-1